MRIKSIMANVVSIFSFIVMFAKEKKCCSSQLWCSVLLLLLILINLIKYVLWTKNMIAEIQCTIEKNTNDFFFSLMDDHQHHINYIFTYLWNLYYFVYIVADRFFFWHINTCKYKRIMAICSAIIESNFVRRYNDFANWFAEYTK